jgi:hypothetical protein
MVNYNAGIGCNCSCDGRYKYRIETEVEEEREEMVEIVLRGSTSMCKGKDFVFLNILRLVCRS